MKGSFQIASFAGIPVKLHWTFGLVFLWVFYISFTSGLDAVQIAFALGFVLLIFLCVVLHEYGHALMARRFDVITRDIILSPIGGIARLERIPKRPLHEFLIAIAGPLVNVVIAILIAAGILIVSGNLPELTWRFWHFEEEPSLAQIVFQVNIILIVFNMIPAFPMDGGRVFRALLSSKMDRVKATHIASIVGRVLAVGFISFGVYRGDMVLSVIGLFIFFSARNEYRAVHLEHKLENYTLRDLVNPNLPTLTLQATMIDAKQMLEVIGAAGLFIVNDEGTITGLIDLLAIKEAVKNEKLEDPVGAYVSHAYQLIDVNAPLRHLYSLMVKNQYTILPVTENAEIIGFVDRNAFIRLLRD